MFSPVTIILFNKKATKQVHKKIGIFNYTRDHSTSIKVLKKAGVVLILNHSKTIRSVMHTNVHTTMYWKTLVKHVDINEHES